MSIAAWVADCFCAIIIYIIFLFNPESSKELIDLNHQCLKHSLYFSVFHHLKMQLSPLIFTHRLVFIFINQLMNNKPVKPAPEEEPKNGGVENIKEYWTQHRTTLIAFQAQYVFNKKPNPREEEENQIKNRKGKKKDIEYEGGFLFPGREGDKEINVVQMIKQSGKFTNLKELFDDSLNHSQDTLELREFVKIMLELKHPCIVKEFMEIYDNIIKEIKDVKFDQIKAEDDRYAVVDRIRDKVAGFVTSYAHTFKNFSGYLRDDRIETLRLFKVTAYCFLAEKFNFNINEFYSNAFEFHETEKKKTSKKNKTQKEDLSNN